MARFGLRRGKTDADAEPTGAQPAAPTPSGPTPGATQPPSPPTTGSQPVAGTPEPTTSERLEGQRAWIAQLDRRIGVRTYAGAAALVIALAAAAVALVLVLQLQDDAATTEDIAQLREEIAGVEDTASEAAQEDVQSLSERLTALETEVADFTSQQDSTDQQISVIQDDIQDLRDQIAEAEDSSSNSGGGAGSIENP